MWRGLRFDVIGTLLLLAVLAATALSGLLADYLGIPRSLYHRLSAYSLVGLALLHVWLRRRALWLRIRGIARRPKPVSSVQSSVAPRTRSPLASRRGFLVSGAAAAAGFVLGRWLLPDLAPEIEEADPGQAYHRWSKPGLSGMLRRAFQWGEPPPLYKEYPSAKRIRLPGASGFRGLYVEEAIQKRRSIRDYSGKPFSIDQVSLLLHSAYGITEPSYPLRASPSAGALYPLEIYPVVNAVTDLPPGIYHYQPRDHSLELIKAGDFRNSLLVGAGGQDMVLRAAVVMVITAVFQRSRWRYQERAYRYILLDAGHLGENLYLAATSLGLAPCGIGAFIDDELNRLIEVDGENEAAVYLVSIGSPA